MKYLFLLSEKFYKFIEWEYKILKSLRSKKKNYLIPGSFIFFSLSFNITFIFLPPIVIGIIFGEGIKFSIFFIWIWILNLKFFLKTLLLFLFINKIKLYDDKNKKRILYTSPSTRYKRV